MTVRQSPSGPPFIILQTIEDLAIPAIDTNTGVDLTVSIAGAEVGDVVVWSPREQLPSPSLIHGAGFVSAPGVVKLRVANVSTTEQSTGTVDVDVAVFPVGARYRLSPSGPEKIVYRSVDTGTIPAIEPGEGSYFTLTVTGAMPGDVVVWGNSTSSYSGGQASASLGAGRVSAPNVVELYVGNLSETTTVAQDTSANYEIFVFGSAGGDMRRPPSGPLAIETKAVTTGADTTTIAVDAAVNLTAFTGAGDGTDKFIIYSPGANNLPAKLRFLGSKGFLGSPTYFARFENAGTAYSLTQIPAGGLVIINTPAL